LPQKGEGLNPERDNYMGFRHGRTPCREALRGQVRSKSQMNSRQPIQQQRHGPHNIALVFPRYPAPRAGAGVERIRLDEHSLSAAGILRFNISP
jgi:hypothetical protein